MAKKNEIRKSKPRAWYLAKLADNMNEAGYIDGTTLGVATVHLLLDIRDQLTELTRQNRSVEHPHSRRKVHPAGASV